VLNEFMMGKITTTH